MHFVTFGSSGSDCEKERVVRTCVRGQGSCFQGKRYQRDLRFFTVLDVAFKVRLHTVEATFMPYGLCLGTFFSANKLDSDVADMAQVP